jgi:DNA replication ATP-dependent helicase Dna2
VATPEPRATTGTADAPDRACFLCAFAEHPCHIAQLDGTVRNVVERWRGGPSPVLLVVEHDAPVAIVLDRRDRDLAHALASLPPDQLRRLRVRAFHLHRAPAHSGPSANEPVADPARATYRTLRTSPASVIVLEPDLLLNITDINNAERCVRQYVLRRMIPSAPNGATLRGTIVHGAFKELLKGRSSDLPALLAQAVRAQATELAVQQLPMAEVAADAEPHLAALATWYTRQRQQLWTSTPHIRVETFVLAPQVGLKGRLDALWEDEHTSQLLELKTSTVRGELPRREHRWQVYGYQTLLASRGHGDNGRPSAATLLYSGAPGQAEAYTLPFSLRELQRVLELRNLLAIAHATGEVPSPPGERTCGRCMLRSECAQVSPLLGWEPPHLAEHSPPLDPRDIAWFRRYYELLALEGRAAEAQGHMLWTTTPAERCAAGAAIGNLQLAGPPEPTTSGEWEYVFHCQNTSELREGDPVLLSDGDPIQGAAVTGTLLSVTDRSLVVWTPERITHPTLVDRYGSDIVHDRTVRNLWRWLASDPHLRAVVRGEVPPTVAEEPGEMAPPPGFNREQTAAVRGALAARDFLLIQGPPGTGKTRVVAEIVRRSVARGERVLIAAFTNQAVDNVLARLVADGFHDLVRLGHELSVAPDLRRYRLAARAATLAGESTRTATTDPAGPEELHAALLSAPVVASTTATWSAERYDGGGQALAFDLAVVDEATQLTVPALVGALRFARRFVLVGDGQQLPPLVTSADAADRGLKESLFASLLARWGDVGSVRLTRQYRMHPTICAFPSEAFYGDTLVAAGDARTAQLALRSGPRDGLDTLLDPGQPVVFVDVPNSSGHRHASEKVSQAQAQIAQRIVVGLRARGVPPDHIGVIAPYRAQVAAIRQRLASSGERDVTVDTVDRFQGAEREVIVLSFGLEATPPPGSSGAAFLADPHRLNVALTRAQRKLILVGNQCVLEEVPLLARLVAYCASLYDGRGGLIRAQVGTRG